VDPGRRPPADKPIETRNQARRDTEFRVPPSACAHGLRQENS